MGVLSLHQEIIPARHLRAQIFIRVIQLEVHVRASHACLSLVVTDRHEFPLGEGELVLLVLLLLIVHQAWDLLLLIGFLLVRPEVSRVLDHLVSQRLQRSCFFLRQLVGLDHIIGVGVVEYIRLRRGRALALAIVFLVCLLLFLLEERAEVVIAWMLPNALASFKIEKVDVALVITTGLPWLRQRRLQPFPRDPKQSFVLRELKPQILRVLYYLCCHASPYPLKWARNSRRPLSRPSQMHCRLGQPPRRPLTGLPLDSPRS